ncbi:hypothetical protein [Rhodanobacter sp. UC4436_H3]
MSEIPKAISTGVDGTQSQGSALVPTAIAPPMQVATVPDAIDGLLATHSRNLGGDVAARLLAASMRDTSNQLAAAHQTISERNAEARSTAETMTSLRIEIAQLKERLSQAHSSSRTKSICTFVGTALLGVAIDLFKNNLTNAAVLIGLLAAGLLLFVVIPARGASPE